MLDSCRGVKCVSKVLYVLLMGCIYEELREIVGVCGIMVEVIEEVMKV